MGKKEPEDDEEPIRPDPEQVAAELTEPSREQGEEELMGRSGTLIAGFWNTAQMFIPLMGTLLVSIAIARILGPTEFGEQTWIAYISTLLATIMTQTLVRASIQTMSTYRGAGDQVTREAISRWQMWIQIASGALQAIIMLGFAIGSDYSLSWLLASLTNAVNAIGWAYSARKISRDGWAPVAKRRLITQMLAQIVAVIAVMFGAGIMGIFAANLVAAIILFGMLKRISEGATGPKFPPIPRRLLTLWGMYLATELLVQVVSRRIEFVFLQGYSGPEEVGMYGIAFNVITTVTTIPDSMVTAGLPSLAAKAGAGQSDIVNRHLVPAVRVVALISVPMAFGIAALGPELVNVLYGEQYADAGRMTGYMAMLVLFVPVFDLIDTYWGGYGKLGIPLISVSIGGVLDIALAFALIPTYGAYGAVVANVAGQALAALVLLIITYRKLPTLSMDWGRYAVVFLLCAILTVGALYLQSFIPGVLGLILAAVAMGLLLAGFGLAFGFISHKDADWLRDSIPGKLRPFVRVLGGWR